jgi:hypothetical protein
VITCLDVVFELAREQPASVTGIRRIIAPPRRSGPKAKAHARSSGIDHRPCDLHRRIDQTEDLAPAPLYIDLHTRQVLSATTDETGTGPASKQVVSARPILPRQNVPS